MVKIQLPSFIPHREKQNRDLGRDRALIRSFECLDSAVPEALDHFILPETIDSHFKETYRGAWVAQWVKRPTLAQVMISWFVSSSPASGSVLTAQSLEPISDSVSPSL